MEPVAIVTLANGLLKLAVVAINNGRAVDAAEVRRLLNEAIARADAAEDVANEYVEGLQSDAEGAD